MARSFRDLMFLKHAVPLEHKFWWYSNPLGLGSLSGNWSSSKPYGSVSAWARSCKIVVKVLVGLAQTKGLCSKFVSLKLNLLPWLVCLFFLECTEDFCDMEISCNKKGEHAIYYPMFSFRNKWAACSLHDELPENCQNCLGCNLVYSSCRSQWISPSLGSD